MTGANTILLAIIHVTYEVRIVELAIKWRARIQCDYKNKVRTDRL
jgi:hypothetical protein